VILELVAMFIRRSKVISLERGINKSYGKYPDMTKKILQIDDGLCKIMVLVFKGVLFEN